MLNGHGRDEYAWCYFSFKEKPLGTTGITCRNVVEKKCRYRLPRIWGVLNRMKILSTKMRYHDKGGIGTDLFRFFYLDEKDFEERILRQTLIPYVEGIL